MTRRRFARFLREEEGGVISVESMLMLPLLFWVFLATLVFFQAFRAQSTNIKAAFTVGDIISRDDKPITPAYLDSMFTLQNLMNGRGEQVRLRVTAIRFFEGSVKNERLDADDEYRVVWSQVRGGGTRHTNATLLPLRGVRLPTLADQQVTIMTETWTGHSPAFGIGLPAFVFEELVTTHPRNRKTCWNDSNNPADHTTARNVC